MTEITQLAENSTLKEMLEKIQELVTSVNSVQEVTQKTEELVEFGTTVLAENLNSKIWCFTNTTILSKHPQVTENDTVLVISIGGSFDFWSVVARDSRIPVGAETLNVYDPDLIAVKLSYGYLSSSDIRMNDEDFERKLKECMGVASSGSGTYDFDTLIEGLAVSLSSLMLTDTRLEVSK